MWTELARQHCYGSKLGQLACRAEEKNDIKTYEQKAIQAFVAIGEYIKFYP